MRYPAAVKHGVDGSACICDERSARKGRAIKLTAKIENISSFQRRLESILTSVSDQDGFQPSLE